MVRSWCSINQMLLSVLTRKGQVPKHCCLPPRSRPRPRGEVLGQEGYPAGVQEGIHPAPSLLPPASAWPWLRGQVSAGSSCRARSQTPPNQLNCCYYKGECWFQSKKYLDLDQVDRDFYSVRQAYAHPQQEEVTEERDLRPNSQEVSWVWSLSGGS